LLQVGFGNIGSRRTMIAREHPEIKVVGIVEVAPERLNAAREAVGNGCLITPDYRLALATLRPDAVVISTPNHLHAPMVMDALESGAHVLCEKPLAVNATLVQACVELARQRALKLKVGSNHRFWRGMDDLFAVIEQGVIGSIDRIRGEIGGRFSDTNADWYREHDRSGGGTLIDNGSHLIDIVNRILGSTGDRASSLQCETSRSSDNLSVEDHAVARVLTAKGRLVELVVTWLDGDYRMNLDIQGSAGQIRFRGFRELSVETAGASVVRPLDQVPPGESWQLDLRAFLDAIRHDREPKSSGEDALRCARIIDAMYRGARSSTEESLP
jgi:predicted dehydrogenase